MMIGELQLLEYEFTIRCGFFFGILMLMQLWEAMAPCRHSSSPRVMRWFSNVGLLTLGTIVLRAIFPLASLGVAAIAKEQQWGIFYTLPLTHWQTVVLSVICLDFITYLNHVLFHALPALWRFHRVHHADLDFDVTTGLRFHPVEILLSMANRMIIILLLGTPIVAVLIFEIILNATSMFNHGNVRLPAPLERLLRLFVITPDMHRIHHSAITKETNSNFGFNIPWWDYIFGTYRRHPLAGHQEMVIGLVEHQQDLRVVQLHWMLVFPFLNHLSKTEEPVLRTR
ncbi:sterol desaturase family protein [Leptolyngbyaceae cyanobacterium CCMR0082]|uniref:Sterol desaturase family protein n=2 Tax=Adonisia turfae TaxID=2950184 RepID=A0A6M0SEJ0_9CYAN|nr:sterol desaturase family protein [Adonisia turfae]MDV3348706.1 sterol desaturase family protein [Leptothoe sp. LEGE 181152]NEZ54504.1 sterol desaturase family protein [Adonisia turfae CCMR0081]NEZ66930.1 sterol desaturase family protein [Adonisia turfae CCMR0082]